MGRDEKRQRNVLKANQSACLEKHPQGGGEILFILKSVQHISSLSKVSHCYGHKLFLLVFLSSRISQNISIGKQRHAAGSHRQKLFSVFIFLIFLLTKIYLNFDSVTSAEKRWPHRKVKGFFFFLFINYFLFSRFTTGLGSFLPFAFGFFFLRLVTQRAVWRLS